MVSEKVIFVDPNKVEAVEGWLQPSNVCGIQSVVGLVGYY